MSRDQSNGTNVASWLANCFSVFTSRVYGFHPLPDRLHFNFVFCLLFTAFILFVVVRPVKSDGNCVKLCFCIFNTNLISFFCSSVEESQATPTYAEPAAAHRPPPLVVPPPGVDVSLPPPAYPPPIARPHVPPPHPHAHAHLHVPPPIPGMAAPPPPGHVGVDLSAPPPGTVPPAASAAAAAPPAAGVQGIDDPLAQFQAFLKQQDARKQRSRRSPSPYGDRRRRYR
jgi:hypothetical protein